MKILLDYVLWGSCVNGMHWRAGKKECICAMSTTSCLLYFLESPLNICCRKNNGQPPYFRSSTECASIGGTFILFPLSHIRTLGYCLMYVFIWRLLSVFHFHKCSQIFTISRFFHFSFATFGFWVESFQFWILDSGYRISLVFTHFIISNVKFRLWSECVLW